MAKARQKTDRLLLPRMGRSRLSPKQDQKNGAEPSSFAYFIISLPGAGPRAAGPKCTERTDRISGKHLSPSRPAHLEYAEPPYLSLVASREDTHAYMLGDTAIVLFATKYSVRANPDQVDRHDQTDAFIRSAATWKLKISRSSPHQKTES